MLLWYDPNFSSSFPEALSERSSSSSSVENDGAGDWDDGDYSGDSVTSLPLPNMTRPVQKMRNHPQSYSQGDAGNVEKASLAKRFNEGKVNNGTELYLRNDVVWSQLAEEMPHRVLCRSFTVSVWR